MDQPLFSPLPLLFLFVLIVLAIGIYIKDRLPEKTPRLTGWTILAVALVGIIGVIAPQQLPVVLYKLALVIIGGIVGYWLDRGLFPYARPHEQYNSASSPVQGMSCLRRALIVIACVLGLTMGL
jgi:hypothetical protein